VEFQERGFQPEEARELCKILEDNRFDFVELSGGTYEENHFVHKRDSSKKREAFFMEFADLIVPALKDTKAYVTGGFRSVGGMIDALATVDGIGLARPLAAEPHLAKDIISGKVTGAIKHVFDDSDFLLTNVLAGTQMSQIGKDQQPLDASDPKVAEAFGKDLGTFMQRMGEDKNMEMIGYVELINVPVQPIKVA
jgi:2,4-dienoyl-CoA reductase-like NADH-dependent reductase (Old Yellow Enzyme family)